MTSAGAPGTSCPYLPSTQCAPHLHNNLLAPRLKLMLTLPARHRPTRRFPYLQQMLLEPDFNGTVFAPTDSAWAATLGLKDTAACLAHIATELEQSFNPEPVLREAYATRWWWKVSN